MAGGWGTVAETPSGLSAGVCASEGLRPAPVSPSGTANPTPAGPGPEAHPQGIRGATRPSQQHPGEFSAMELVKRDHPEGCVPTAVTHARGGSRAAAANLGAAATSSPCTAAHLLRRGSRDNGGPASGPRPLPGLLHTCPGQRPERHLDSHLALSLFRCDLGQVNFPEPFFTCNIEVILASYKRN